MKILFLGEPSSEIFQFLTRVGEEVLGMDQILLPGDVVGAGFDFLVSHGYRHILKSDVLECFPVGRAVNLHISLLPWNRGADPNFWSWLEQTPKGVSVHCISEGIDTGSLLTQRHVTFGYGQTLASSYQKLQAELVGLFCENWDAIRTDAVEPQPQEGEGSYHKRNDLKAYRHLLVDGWDTPVGDIEAAGQDRR